MLRRWPDAEQVGKALPLEYLLESHTQSCLVVGKQTCLTAMLKRGGILNSTSTAANRIWLPLFADADELATASHLMLLHACLRRLSCWCFSAPVVNACT